MKGLYLLLLLFVVGCSEETDSVVTGGEFSVHFENQKDHELAKELVEFWKEQELMSGKKQDVKLVRTKEGYDLLLISIQHKSMEDLKFEEIRALTKLQSSLQDSIFKEKEVSLVITDDTFKTLFRPSI